MGQDAWAKMARLAAPLDEPILRRLSPLLILAPHQDDETLGCGGLIAAATALGLRPRVAYLTDGAASHIGSPTWPPARIARVRRREALEALAVLGVGEDDVRFLGWADASPFDEGAPEREHTLDAVLAWMRAFNPRGLWAPWEGELHCDHLAAARLARDLARRYDAPLAQMSYLVWGWSQPELPDCASAGEIWAISCRETAPRRRRALARHLTQTTPLIDDADQAFLIPPELAALTQRPVEIHLGRP